MSSRVTRDNRIITIGALLIGVILIGNLVHYVASQPAHPVPVNTIQHGTGMYFPVVDADDYFYRGYNVTAFFEAVAEWVEEFEFEDPPVWESTVEWGYQVGHTGQWFNHTLSREPIYIGLEMDPSNLTYDGELVFPRVYDKHDSQWQVAFYFYNGTQIIDIDFMVMYHLRIGPPGPD